MEPQKCFSKVVLVVFTMTLSLSCIKYLDDSLKDSTKTDSGLVKGDILLDNWRVSEDDIYAYYQSKVSKKEIKNLVPYPSNSEPLCYIVNFDDGWEIISGDKRTPITMAEGEKGEFTINSLPRPIKCWIDLVCSDIRLLSINNLSLYNSSQRERIEYNLRRWNRINNWKFLTKEDSCAQGRAFIPPGLWVADGMTVETEVLDSVHHFFSTRWHQEAPFNNYCPLYFPSITSRCMAGCVAIAGAQMLYYLHNKLGVPETAPTSGQSSGYVYNGTNDFSSWGSSTTVWNYMSTALITTTQRDTSAILIADVGKRVGMNYGLNQSSAGFVPLVSNVFNHYGIDCAYNNYQQDTVSSNLLRGLPVLIGAFSDSNYNNGHVFAVDGYKLTRRKDVYHYYWQPNPNYEGVQPHRPGETMEEVFYWQPEVSSYGINWGQNLSNPTMMNLNNSWYRVDGDWYLGSYNYTWYRTMMSNFQILVN